MNNHKERLRFERFWVENFEPDTFDDVEYSEILNTYDSNYIVTDDLNRSWLAWQARAKAQAVPDQLDVNSILHDIDCYFDNGLSNTERTANNLLQSIYEKLSGEIEALTGANA